MYLPAKIPCLCGFILLALLLCPTVTAYDGRAVQYYNEGNIFLNLGQYTEAIASYDKPIAIDPNNGMAKKNREIILEKQSQAQQTRSTPLLYAPIGAIVLMAGIAVWSRRRDLLQK